MMERKVICDLHLISVDFGREEERQPGNTFRITFRHANGQPTGTIDVYQGEAAHFSVELEAIAAFSRRAYCKQKFKLRHYQVGIVPAFARQFLCNERLRGERPGVGRSSLSALSTNTKCQRPPRISAA